MGAAVGAAVGVDEVVLSTVDLIMIFENVPFAL